MTNKNKLNNPLALWFYHQIARAEQKTYQKAIMHDCKLSKSTFYTRLQNPHKFSKAEAKHIAEISGKDINTLFPHLCEQ